ncbi:MAG: hypothetical protein IJF92_00085 [Bacilli bacterium]|nr:hypothetical protein [Bacilli bacterium]MBQ3307612.1 hypothetical protein [Bacilli bacterium]
MTFETIMKFIVETGISTVISGLMIYVFYKLIEKQMKDTDKLRQSQDEQSKKILERLLEYTPYTITPKKYDENVAIDKEINIILQRLKDSLGSSRAYLVTFHNGGKDLSGLSFLKMSMRNEITAPSIKPLQPEFQNVFRNTLSYLCNELGEKGFCYIQDYKNLEKADSSFFDFMNSRGVISIYSKAIKDNDNHIIGFIGVEYMSTPEVNLEQIEHCLTDKKNKIEAILNLVHKEN